MLRKINAILGVLTSVLLVAHGAIECVMMVTQNDTAPAIPAFVYLGIVGVHIILSEVLVFSKHDEAGRMEYPELNKRTILQRLFGMLTIVFLVLHVISAVLNGNGIVMFSRVTNMILFVLMSIVASVHMAVSLSKGLVTVGIVRSQKAAKVIDCIAVIVMIAVISIAICVVMFWN